jgi:hypothetical protein
VKRLLLLAIVVWPALAGAAPKRGDVPVGGACAHDRECAVGAICTDNVCEALPKGKRAIPFYWHQPGEVGYRGILPGMYFSDWDRERKIRIQFPFFAQRVRHKDQSTTTVIPPLAFWYTHYKGRGHEVGAPPFFFWRQRGTERLLALPLLLSGGRRDAARNETDAVIALLGYYRQRGDDKWRIVFPLVWDHQKGDARTAVAPLTYLHRDKRGRAGVIFPLLWHFASTEKGKSDTVLLPFAYWGTRDHGDRARLISPLVFWSRQRSTGTAQLLLLAPPYYHRNDRQLSLDVAFPLFARWARRDKESSGLIAGPVFHVADREGATSGLFPLYWRFADRARRAQTHLLLPLGGMHLRPGAALGFVGPAYGFYDKNEGGAGGGLAPLVMFGRRGPRFHQVVLPPLFVRWGNRAKGEATTVVGPVFHRASPVKQGWDAGLFPLAYFGKRPQLTYAAVLPLFWARKDASGTDVVVPPLYVAAGQQRWQAALFPLVFLGRDHARSHQVIFPVLFHFADRDQQRDTWVAGPFVYHRRAEKRQVGLFPLFYARTSPGRGLFVSPLSVWHKTPERTTLVIGPYGYARDARRDARTHVLFPLFVWHKAPRYEVAVQFPFFWRVKDGDETDTVVFPFYWRVRTPTRAVDVFFPLVFHTRSEKGSTTVAGPFWWKRDSDGSRALGLLGLFAYGNKLKDGKATRYLGVPGAFYYKNEAAGTSLLLATPLFYRTTRPDGWKAGLVPLFFAWRKDTRTSMVAPFLLFYHRRDRAADDTLTVVGPLYFGHTGKKTRFGLIPLLYHWTRPDQERSETLLLPLLYYRQKKVGHAVITPILGWNTYADGAQVVVGPLYVRKDRARTTAALFPLVYFDRDHAAGTRTDMFLPFYFDTQAQSRRLTMFTPLGWRYRSVERQVVVGLPFYIDVKNYAESRTTGIFPFAFRHRSLASKSTTWFFPPLLTWVRKRWGEGNVHDAVVFPLLWHFGGKDKATTVVLPLWWDFKRGENRTQVLLPVMARWKRANADHLIVLNMYYRRGRGDREGSWFCDIFPIINFGRPRKGDITWKFLEGLFGYSRSGRNRILHLFWLFDIPLAPASPAALGWWSNTPPEARTVF